MGATLKYFKVHLDLEADQMEPLFLALEDKKSFCPLLRKLIVHKNRGLVKLVSCLGASGVGRFVDLNASEKLMRQAVFKGD